MKGEIYDKKKIYDQLNKDVYFKDGGSMNLASLAGSIEKIRSKSKSSGNGSDSSDSPNVTKRFKTEWVKGEDEVNVSSSQADVILGEFAPDFDGLLVNGEPQYKVGDVIDVPYKEVDITNLMLHNNGSAETEETQHAIPTRIHYKLPDGENYAAGDQLRCIRYERIAELPNDPNIKFSTLFIYTNGFFYSMGASYPESPCYMFETYWVEAMEDEETGESYPEGFRTDVQFTNESNNNTYSDPREGYITFNGVEAEGDIYVIEGYSPDSAFIPKSQGDGYTSILDYYRFYFFANSKMYVVSRSGNYARPVDISKNVIEDLREEVKSLKSEKMADIGFGNFLSLYNTSDLNTTLPKAEFASAFCYITGFGDLSSFCDVSVVDKLFFGKVRNIYGKIRTGASAPLEQLAFKILYTVSEGMISTATVLLAPSESAIEEEEYLRFEYSGGSTVTVTRSHRQA